LNVALIVQYQQTRDLESLKIFCFEKKKREKKKEKEERREDNKKEIKFTNQFRVDCRNFLKCLMD